MTVHFHEEDLPEGVRSYIDRVERETRCAIKLVSVGADREHTITLANFINKNPTVVMLALGFLLMIGVVLIADGFGVHVPKGYIYAAMAFSALVEGLNMMQRRRGKARQAKAAGG